jgi:Domain of unknown function (DUF4340)
MDTKKIGSLAIVLGLILLLAYFTGAFDSAPSTIDVPDLSIDSEAIDRIEVKSPAFSVLLDRESGRWELTSPLMAAADSAVVATFLRDLGESKLESTVSFRPERYGKYGVDSTASRITLGTGSGQRTIVVSKQGPDYSSVYLRIGDDPKVYVSKPRISVPAGLDRWRDKRILSFTSRAVLEASVTTPDYSYTVSKGATGWTLKKDGAESQADSSAVARWLSQFSPLRGDGFFDSGDALQSTTHNLTIRLSDGTSTGLVAGPNGSDLAALAAGSNGTIFKLYSSRKTSLFPDPETLTGDK